MPTYVAGMTNSSSGLLAALMLIAVSALGCGGSEETGATQGKLEGLPQVSGPLDSGRPAIGNLDPDLLVALQAAAGAAQDDGVRMVVTSGWRSRAHQQRLFDEAVIKYGSEAEAIRWVSTPDTSAHVSGDAVDIGPTDAADWLSRHGADYGLCQIFANEIWHYELATTLRGQCPDMFPDSSYRSP